MSTGARSTAERTMRLQKEHDQLRLPCRERNRFDIMPVGDIEQPAIVRDGAHVAERARQASSALDSIAPRTFASSSS